MGGKKRKKIKTTTTVIKMQEILQSTFLPHKKILVILPAKRYWSFKPVGERPTNAVNVCTEEENYREIIQPTGIKVLNRMGF